MILLWWSVLISDIPLALSWEPTARLASLHVHALSISLLIHHNWKRTPPVNKPIPISERGIRFHVVCRDSTGSHLFFKPLRYRLGCAGLFPAVTGFTGDPAHHIGVWFIDLTRFHLVYAVYPACRVCHAST
ncbi:TPA: hypothetical protein I3806_000501 [Enterobacter cloacae]|nr:hypothetical protein [Enterobacter cloacae]